MDVYVLKGEKEKLGFGSYANRRIWPRIQESFATIRLWKKFARDGLVN